MLWLRQDRCDIIPLEFLKRNETRNAHLYIQQLQRGHKKNLTNIAQRKNLIPRNDSTWPQKAKNNRDFGWSALPDFTIFTWPCISRLLQFSFAAKHFEGGLSLRKTRFKISAKKYSTTKTAEFYSKDIEKLLDNWQEDIGNNGEYTTE